MGTVGDGKPDPLLTDRGVKSSSASPPRVATVLAAGVDYLTCTASEPARAELLAALGQEIVYGQAEQGNDLRPWAWKGYDGITSGAASVGRRDDGYIVRLSGECAASCWHGPLRVSDHVSRLDLAVTVRLPADANPAREAFTQETWEGERRRGRQVQRATHIETWTEGETAYLGSRKSARYGRIYNKGLESKEEAYRDAWRWEVEYKGTTATPIARSVAECGSESEAVLAYVWDTFAGWGRPPLWGKGADVSPDIPHRAASDDERRLWWLHSQVASVVQKLVANGRRADVLSALGLD